MYPDGAIKSFEELLAHDSWVYGASREFHTVDDKKLVASMNVCQLYDYNVIKLNGYNDWFVFADQSKAKEWANALPNCD